MDDWWLCLHNLHGTSLYLGHDCYQSICTHSWVDLQCCSSRIRVNNQLGLEATVEAAAEFLNKDVKLVIVGGPKLRVAKEQEAFEEFAKATRRSSETCKRRN